MVIKGKGTTLLSKGTVEKLNVLRIGPVSPGVYLITSEGTEVDVRKQFNIFFFFFFIDPTISHTMISSSMSNHP